MATSYNAAAAPLHIPRPTQFCEAIKTFQESDSDMGMTRDGRFVSEASFNSANSSSVGKLFWGFTAKAGLSGPIVDQKTKESFDQCKTNFREALNHYQQKCLFADRTVTSVEPTLSSARALAKKLTEDYYRTMPSSSFPGITEGQLDELAGYLQEQWEAEMPELSQQTNGWRNLTLALYGLKTNLMEEIAKNLFKSGHGSEQENVALLERVKKDFGKTEGLSTETVQLPENTPLQTGYNPVTGDATVRGRSFQSALHKTTYPTEFANPRLSKEEFNQLEYEIEDDPARLNDQLKHNNTQAELAGTKDVTPREPYNIHLQAPKLKSYDEMDELGDYQVKDSLDIPGWITTTTQGRTMYDNEDAALAFKCYCLFGSKVTPVKVSAVFDGHGENKATRETGQTASAHAVKRFMPLLHKRLEMFNSDGLTEVGIHSAFTTAMVDMDRDRAMHGIGTTALCATVIGNRLWVANLGDCRALLLNQDGTFKQLTEDGRVQSEDPSFSGTSQAADSRFNQTIHERGGEIIYHEERSKDGTHLKISGNPDEAAVGAARSIGDHGHNGVLSARPVITSYPLDEQTLKGHLLLCSDGLTEVATSSQINEMRNKLKATYPEMTDADLSDLSMTLVHYAFSCGSRDNLTASIVPLASLASTD